VNDLFVLVGRGSLSFSIRADLVAPAQSVSWESGSSSRLDDDNPSGYNWGNPSVWTRRGFSSRLDGHGPSGRDGGTRLGWTDSVSLVDGPSGRDDTVSAICMLPESSSSRLDGLGPPGRDDPVSAICMSLVFLSSRLDGLGPSGRDDKTDLYVA